MQITVSSVMERDIAIDPLGVCDLKQLENKLLGPVLSI
jgi:hypothetical protein